MSSMPRSAEVEAMRRSIDGTHARFVATNTGVMGNHSLFVAHRRVHVSAPRTMQFLLAPACHEMLYVKPACNCVPWS